MIKFENKKEKTPISEDNIPIPDKSEKNIEELLEYVVLRINELTKDNEALCEQVKTLSAKAEIVVENVIEPKAYKRKIVLNRDSSGKIIGADVIDTAEDK